MLFLPAEPRLIQLLTRAEWLGSPLNIDKADLYNSSEHHICISQNLNHVCSNNLFRSKWSRNWRGDRTHAISCGNQTCYWPCKRHGNSSFVSLLHGQNSHYHHSGRTVITMGMCLLLTNQKNRSNTT